MRLMVHTDHALRFLTYLALKKDGLATIAEIAATYGIIGGKVAYELGVAGMSGVFEVGGLAKPAGAIVLGEVVRQNRA